MVRTTAGGIAVAFLVLSVSGCGLRSAATLPAVPNSVPLERYAHVAPVPNVGGVYNGTATETSGGKSIKAKLKLTIRQSGSKFTGIFDMILKKLQDQFPIIKGAVGTENGKTVLHFVIEGSPGRNAKAFATVTGSLIKGRAKVSSKNGPAVFFKYSAKK